MTDTTDASDTEVLLSEGRQRAYIASQAADGASQTLSAEKAGCKGKGGCKGKDGCKAKDGEKKDGEKKDEAPKKS